MGGLRASRKRADESYGDRERAKGGGLESRPEPETGLGLEWDMKRSGIEFEVGYGVSGAFYRHTGHELQLHYIYIIQLYRLIMISQNIILYIYII